MKPGAEVTIKALSKGFEVLWSDDEGLTAEPVAGCTTMECVFAFIRSRMEPQPLDCNTIRATVGTITKASVEVVEPEGDEWARGDKFTPKEIQEAMAQVTPFQLNEELSRSLPPLATPEEPAWKRAKVGDWVKLKDGSILPVSSTHEGMFVIRRVHVRDEKGLAIPVANSAILSIVPPPSEDDAA